MHPLNRTSYPSGGYPGVEHAAAQDARELIASHNDTLAAVTHPTLRPADTVSGNLVGADEAQEVIADD